MKQVYFISGLGADKRSFLHLKLLPNRFVNADYIVQGGTHVMTLDRPAEVSALLKKLIL